MNYKFIIRFDIGRFEVIIWRKLDETYEMTSINKLQNLGSINTLENLGSGIAGGWNNLDIENLDDFAMEAANAAIGHGKKLLEDLGTFKKIIVAQMQVVAGINYKFHLEFMAGDGGRVHFEIIVWRKLNGTYLVTSANVVN